MLFPSHSLHSSVMFTSLYFGRDLLHHIHLLSLPTSLSSYLIHHPNHHYAYSIAISSLIPRSLAFNHQTCLLRPEPAFERNAQNLNRSLNSKINQTLPHRFNPRKDRRRNNQNSRRSSKNKRNPILLYWFNLRSDERQKIPVIPARLGVSASAIAW
jgi:hypothetical protein